MSTPVSALLKKDRSTILLVDEQPEVRLLVFRIFETAGYDVLLAGSAEEALLVCQRHAGEIHLLVTETQLPGQSGVELAEQFERLRPGSPILFLSASAPPQDAPWTATSHSRLLLTKPFDTRHLLRKVRFAIHQATAQAVAHSDC